MKKTVGLLLLIMLTVILTSCQSKEARAADKMIKELGTITLDSESSIANVQEIVDSLTQEDKDSLKNLELFEEAKTEYYNLGLIKKVEDTINAIGSVTIQSESAIKAAKEAFSELDPTLQVRVSNSQVLIDAENQYNQALAEVIDDAIAKIGEVSLNSGVKIKEARDKYDKATDEVKTFIQKGQLLEDSEKKYHELRVEKSISLINAIGAVELSSENAINDARKQYDGLDSIERMKVTNYETLVKAESELKEKKLEKQIKEVETAIDAIGTVTLSSKTAIERAEEKFNSLIKAAPSGARERVSNLDDLAKAKETYKTLLKEEYDSAVSRMRIDKDDVQGVTFYTPKQFPYYTNSRCALAPYIGVNNTYNNNSMIIEYDYAGSSWVFFKKVIISVDGEQFTKTFNYFDIQHDIGGGMVGETIHDSATSQDIEMLRKIVTSTKTIVRFEGDHYRHDLTISSADKKAIQDVLIMYDYLNGNY